MHWFKAHNEALSDPKIAWVARQAKVSLPEAFGWWMSILSIASASPERGKLMLTETEPYTAEDIACNVTCNVSVTLAMLHTFQRAGLLAQNEDVYEVVNWAKRQGNAKPGAQRTRECRERKQVESVTLPKRYCNAIELEQEIEIDKENVPPNPLKGEVRTTKTNGHDPNFDTWWEAYPKKRAKPDAEKSWKKNAPKRPQIADMLKALEWQRVSYDWTKDGGQFIPNPTTYLNQGRWTDEPQGATNGRPLYNFEKNQGTGAGADTGADYDTGGDGSSPFDDAIFDD